MFSNPNSLEHVAFTTNPSHVQLSELKVQTNYRKVISTHNSDKSHPKANVRCFIDAIYVFYVFIPSTLRPFY